MSRLELTAVDGCRLALTLDCSAGFYVRALARDLGERLGTGGHLVALRRTRIGALTLDQAIPLADAERDRGATTARVVPMSLMLTDLPAMTLDADGVRRTIHGGDVPGFGIRGSGFGGIREPGFVRLLDEAGQLVAIAEPSAATAGFLHPSVVLR